MGIIGPGVIRLRTRGEAWRISMLAKSHGMCGDLNERNYVCTEQKRHLGMHTAQTQGMDGERTTVARW